MTDPLVLTTVSGGVARITLNRPQKRNALSRAVIERFAESVHRVRNDETVRLLILAAEGPVFCAGMDLGEMESRAAAPDAAEQWRADTQVYRDLVVGLFTLEVPTLAVVQGPVVAGGVGLVAACDLVLASESAFFALPEPKRGITAAIVAPLLLHRTGFAGATRLLLSGRNVPAEQMLPLGLCHEVVHPDALAAREREWTASILGGAPGALAETKRLLLDFALQGVLKRIDAAAEVSARARESAEAREGLAAFLEKRPPAWQANRETTSG